MTSQRLTMRTTKSMTFVESYVDRIRPEAAGKRQGLQGKGVEHAEGEALKSADKEENDVEDTSSESSSRPC